MKKFIILVTSAFLVACGGGSSSGGGSSGGGSSGGNNITPPGLKNPTPVMQVKNLGYTVFAGKSYEAEFIFTNNTGGTLNITNSSLTSSYPGVWKLLSNTCAGSLGLNQSCTISGTFLLVTANTSSNIDIKLNNNNELIQEYKQTTTAIPFGPISQSNPAYFALRFINVNSNQTVYIAASENNNSGQPSMIQFNSSGVGTITNQNSEVSPSWNSFAVSLSPSSTNVFYIPQAVNGGGKMYISIGNKLSNGGSPNPSGGDTNDNNTPWQEVEFAFVNTATQPFIDITNVNVMSIPLSLNGTTRNHTPLQLTVNAGPYYDGYTTSMSTILNNVKSALSSWPTTWGTLSNYNGTNQQLIRILSPVSLAEPLASVWTDSFTNYINEVWNYYSQPGNNIYVDATEITAFGGPGGAIIPETKCILEGHVVGDNMLFTVAPGTGSNCPISTTTGDYNGGGITGTSLTPITKFTAGDFLLGAPGAAYTLWGPDKSYRAVIGREIAASQSVGFLPFCPNPSIVLNKTNLTAQSNLYYTPQYYCLPNYASYKDSVINQYANQNAKYFSYYGYAYSDALGQDNTLNINDAGTDPVTLTILKTN